MTTHDLLDRIREGVWDNHCIFNAFYDASAVILDRSIPTACVAFDSDGNILYRFNPDFVGEIDDYLLSFIFCHETLHIILNHLYRFQNTEDKERANKAMDIVINHTLCREFGFERGRLADWDKYCWVDTCFEEDDLPPENKSWEFYYKMLEREGKAGANTQTVDQHNWGKDGEGVGSLGDLPDTIKDKIEGRLRDVINQQAGTEALGEEFYFDVFSKKKKKWESIIKKTLQKVERRNYTEQWVFPNNRSVFLRNDLIPQSAWCVAEDDDKLDLVFFMDLSGSCLSFRERFFKAALSIPHEKFRVQAYSFDHSIYPVDLKKKNARGGGGTSFQILENRLRNMKKYPDMVFCLTDGYGDPIAPAKPKNWTWFLTEEGTPHFIETMRYFSLSDFE